MGLKLLRLAMWGSAILACVPFSVSRAARFSVTGERDSGGQASSSPAPGLKSTEQAYDAAEQARRNGDNAAALKGYETAFKGFMLLAKQGNPDAEYYLGKMYLMGQGVLKDPVEANKLLTAAAEQGNADAQFFLGAPGVLHGQNLTESLELLNLSAEQGNQDAQLLLGQSYLRGFPGALTPDPAEADMWLRLAAKDNLPFYNTQLLAAERQMSSAAIAKGKALAESWKPKHGLHPIANSLK